MLRNIVELASNYSEWIGSLQKQSDFYRFYRREGEVTTNDYGFRTTDEVAKYIFH